MKIAILGSGNMGGAIAVGLADGNTINASDIVCTAKSATTLQKIKEKIPEVNTTQDNCEAIKGADIIVIAVKPWFVESVLGEIRESIDYERQMIVSVAAGVSFGQMKEYLGKKSEYPVMFRVIPNTAIAIKCSMTFVASCNATPEQEATIVSLFDELGCAMLVEESQIAAGTALASCGIAYAMRYIRAATEGGVELGFRPAVAQKIVSYTVEGAARLLLQNGNNPEAEIDKVTTPGGITIKGLNEMEHNGFTSAVIKGLKASKA